MDNYYKILGVTNGATASEIRRAYRILARRYHPDLNPGEENADTFKKIARAYAVLADPEQRQQYDSELEKDRESFFSAFDKAHSAYRKNQESSSRARPRAEGERKAPPKQAEHKGAQAQEPRHKAPPKKPERGAGQLDSLASRSKETLRQLRHKLLRTKAEKGFEPKISQLSLMEVSISVMDAIRGIRRTVELTDAEGKTRKISAHIPPGVRSGSIVRFRRKEDPREEVILVIRVAHHPWLSMSPKGVTMEIPITVSEAIQGGKIQVPSLGEPLLVTVEPGMQSGNEVRLKGQGVFFKDGSRGDPFIRFLIKVPDAPGAAGLKERCQELDSYYGQPVRKGLPRSILDD